MTSQGPGCSQTNGSEPGRGQASKNFLMLANCVHLKAAWGTTGLKESVSMCGVESTAKRHLHVADPFYNKGR